MASEVTASLIPINPDTLFSSGYELTDQSIIPNENIISAFEPNKDKVEYWIYDLNKTLIDGLYDFIDYTLVQNPTNSGEQDKNNTSTVEVSPIEDAYNLGYDQGKLYSVYNFVRYHLSSSNTSRYYISEISSDRTEIRLKSNNISNEDIARSFNDLRVELDSSEYFDEFYITPGGGKYNIGVNVQLDTTTETYSILVKLYDALPFEYDLKDELYVITKVAESVGYQIAYPDIIDLPSNVKFLKGPNTNLEIKDFVNNSTELKSKSELVNTNSSSSKDNLANILNREGVTITPNYSYDTFNEFVNFSSAKKRIENFIEKVEQIQSYESDIELLNTITGPTSESFEISSSIASAYTNIENLVKNFDGYEYFLYYNTGSSSYPKTGSAFPFTLLPTTDATVTQWLGSDNEGSQYYGGILLSASFYDNRNQNYLYYTIPEFIRDNESNNQYVEFSNMVGQHFDEIWLYTKAVSERNNTTSNLDDGIPLKLADDAISALGYKGFGNNFNNQDNFIGLTGEDSGSYVPPTGSEFIDNYIAVNGGQIVNYWSDFYSDQFYVDSIDEPGYPYAIDKVSKEIFKRLYHNMSYLVKKKGTISGLRQLINIWGIPNTILRINEFGGKNKDESDDYDLWYNRYSYAFSPITTQNYPSASVVFPWMPLERNRVAESEYIVPDSLQFRFKTTGIPSSSFAGEFFTQSLAVKKSDGDDTSTDFDFGIALFYTGSTSGSYLGSSSSEYENWGNMRFYMSGSSVDGGVAVSNNIYLPFFDKGWWSVMLQRNQHIDYKDNSNATTYTLYVKNKTYNGWDGNSIGFEGSASIVSNVSESVNDAWNKFGTGSADGIYLGGFISGSNVGGITLNEPGKMISGSLQEFRYYSQELPETKFNDFVMNPESIEGINITGSLSSFDILNFRAPLGNEMESMFTSSQSSSYVEPMTSLHPAITGSAEMLITGSFVNPTSLVTSSVYNVLYYDNTSTRTYSKTNTEVYFLDQPAMGLRNRISNKVQVENGLAYGNTLSSLTSIEQDYQISRSYTEDISSLEVAFSPQEEVNDDIIATFGYGVVADALADPRFISESSDHYPQLRKTAEEYFQKYTKGNVYDYLRLIKYFDNSIFKAIKNYVPARTNVTTGIVIKQHLLERNRYPQPKLNEVTTIARYASGSGGNITYNNPIDLENLELTASLSISDTTGSAGGSVNKFNYNGSPEFDQPSITQSWIDNRVTALGLISEVENTQKEFYDGEYSGSKVIATTQSLLDNPYNPPTYQINNYDFSVYNKLNTTGSCEFYINVSSNSTTALNALDNYQPSQQGEHGLSLYTPAPGIYYIAAIALQEVYPFQTSTPIPGLIGEPGFENPFPGDTPPYSGGYTFNKIAPYFQFSLSGAQSSGTFNNDSNFNNVSESEIYSITLNPTSDVTNQYGMRVQKYKLNNSSRRITGPTFSNTSHQATILFGNFEYEKSLMLDSNFGDPVQGEGSIYFYPLEYTQSATNIGVTSGKWAPMGLAVNKFNDNQNNLESTFKLLPNLKFTLDNNGTAIPSDSNRLSGNEVDTQFLNIDNYSSTRDYYGLTFDATLTGTRFNSGSSTFELSGTSSLTLFDPFVQEVEGVNVFQNSDYFATPNNYNDNRNNSFIMNIEYEDGINIPSNLSLIKNKTAEKTQTPDSNYTQKKNIKPRYEGVKLQSVDYNRYTPPTSSIEFITGDTGSWDGDVSYGKRAAIDKNPIYFAHFKTSQTQPLLFGTIEFTIDELIQVPFEDIGGTPIEPVSLKIEGDNSYLSEVVSTFEKNRSLSIAYRNNTFKGVNYKSLKTGQFDIQNPGSEYVLGSTNQISETETSLTSSYNRFTSEIFNFSSSATDILMTTGSGCLNLSGSSSSFNLIYFTDDQSFGFDSSTPFMGYSGPYLSIIHTYNYCLKNNIYFKFPVLPWYPGVTEGINSKNNQNYFRMNPTSSGVEEYNNLEEPFLIERGDEIRVTYSKTTVAANLSSSIEYFTQDFTVEGVEIQSYSSPNDYGVGTHQSSFTPGSVDVQVWNKILVSPDPATLTNKIDGGNIYSYTHRKRANADDKMMVFSNPPSGSRGIQTPSNDGFLIPNDLTNIQKRNVATLINQLKAKNAFDDNPNESFTS